MSNENNISDSAVNYAAVDKGITNSSIGRFRQYRNVGTTESPIYGQFFSKTVADAVQMDDDDPTTIKEYVDNKIDNIIHAQTKYEMTASDTDVQIQPNIFYLFPEMTDLTISFAEPIDTTVVQEYHFLFTSGETATTLILPDTVKLPSDFSISINEIYEISILEGCLCCQSWEVNTSA